LCSKECPVSCEEQLFIAESSNSLNQKSDENLKSKIRKLNLNTYKSYYIDINYSPNILFMQYIIGVANLISLWYGLDVTTIMDQIFSFFLKLSMKTEIEIIIKRIVKILMDYSLLRNFIVIMLRTFKSMTKNLQVLQFFF
jgi:predicted metallopeptidase